MRPLGREGGHGRGRPGNPGEPDRQSGAGDILEPEGSAASIGSGSGYALAAARAFCEGTDWPPERIAKRAIELASEICIYTDNVVTLEVLE